MPEVPLVDVVRENLVKAAQTQWVNRLIDLSRRNNLLYYKPFLSGTLELSLNAEQQASILHGDPAELCKLVPENQQLKSSSVREIGRKALENLEEKGLSTLYLAMGKASWPSEDGGRPPEAPVILLPIMLKSHGQDVSTMTLQQSGPLEVNPVLIHVLKSQFGIEIEGKLIRSETNGTPKSNGNGDGEDDTDVAKLLGKLRAECQHIAGFEVNDFAVVGNFSFQKLAMVKDLQQRVGELIGSDIVAAIAGDERARILMGSIGADVDPRSLDLVPPESEFEVVEADSSQQCAIAGVVRGQSAVIHGPPGTGKSQTITNLIATLTALGKKVLFVAEKRAALEVVLARLKNAGLEHLAIDLHGADLSAKKVMEKVARTLQTVRESPLPDCAVMHGQFLDRRKRLNDHSQRMHTSHQPANRTIFEMQAALQKLPANARTSLRWRGADLTQLTCKVVDAALDLLKDAAGFETLFVRIDNSPWNGVSFANGESVQTALDLVESMSLEGWPEYLGAIDQTCSEAGLKTPTTWEEVSELIGCVGGVQASLNDYAATVFLPDTDNLIAILGKAKNELKALWLKATNSEFRTARRNALEMRKRKTVSVASLCRELIGLRELAKRWNRIALSCSGPQSVPSFETFHKKHDEILSKIARLHQIRPLRGWPQGPITETKTDVEGLAADKVTPYKLQRLTEIEEQLFGLGVQRLVDDLRGRKVSKNDWGNILKFAWLSSTLDSVAANDAYVRGFIGSTHSEYVSEFRELDRTRLQMATARVQRAHAEKAIAAMNAHPEQERLIRQEAAKSMRHRSIRRMFKEAGPVLTAVCPCWMASPLSVSQLIDGAAGYFDFVIFDEASQVLPEDAIPAILRAKNVVVAGDNKQLPPTTFFASEDESDVSDDDDTSVGYESLLDMMIPFARSFHLNWHYRSRDESLIAFSNHHIYDDRLVTFPGPGGGPSIRHVAVDHIPHEDGQEASSSAEVKRVVQMILEHARTSPRTTLGVITMGIKHAQRIQGVLDRALSSNRELAEFFDTSRAERFFVKNLERVQGDERDAIIISVGYGKDRAGNLPLRFGPILNDGGRRRLNVAVTRARKSITVVSSFVWSDIDASRVRPGSGLDFLRNYLEYAASGGKIFARGELTNEPMNDFEVDVAEALAAVGITCVPQIGCSKFRIDLAAVHPSEPGRFVLAIECDGATYHSSYTARDRDRLRQQQLENLGWSFHRIWSTDWFLRKDQEVARAVTAYDRAMQNDRAPKNKLPEPARVNGPTRQASQRLTSFAPITKRNSIDEYSITELEQLIEWVNSDGRLRSNDQIADEMFKALPFARRGSRIDAALRRAIASREKRR